MLNTVVSAIIPTIGRPESLDRLLKSLANQSCKPDEVIVADGSEGEKIEKVVEDECWAKSGLKVSCIKVVPPNAVRQRMQSIAISSGEFLLLLDDDVELEPDCLEEMLKGLMKGPDVVAVTADFSNQSWSSPTTAWRLYMRLCCGLKNREWQGKVVGPLLRFGYNPNHGSPMTMEWLGAGNSLVRRVVFDQCGGFSDFFLHRCTMNEDVDLGIKLCRFGRILLLPSARLAHHHVRIGRVSPKIAAEDDLYNRFMVLYRTRGLSLFRSLSLVITFFFIESISNIVGSMRRAGFSNTYDLLLGRGRGLLRIGAYFFSWNIKKK